MSELSAAEDTHPYTGLRLPDGTWIPASTEVDTFILKASEASCMTTRPSVGGSGQVDYNAYEFDCYGMVVCDPLWFLLKGRALGRPVRFKGLPSVGAWVGHRGATHWRRVFCLDDTAPNFWRDHVEQLLRHRMYWEVMFYDGFANSMGFCDIKRGCRVDRSRRRNSEQRFLRNNVRVIRLRMYWVLRGIVTLKRMLERARRRYEKRKLFIRATYWGHPECVFSRFAGTINTPVKQRIYAYI